MRKPKVSPTVITRTAVVVVLFVVPIILVANIYSTLRILSGYQAHDASHETSPPTKGLVGAERGATLAAFSSDDLARLTNKVRANEGKPPLQPNPLLDTSARAKCDEMVAQNYWAHVSPAGKQPWVFFDAVGYTYSKAGENLAYGFGSDQSVIDGWMNSPTHHENLMGRYTEVGFGICESTNYQGTGHQVVIVQHFGTPKAKQASAPSVPTVTQAPVYRPPACTKTPIPYKTTYIDAPYMYEGETNESGGIDGYSETCTADSNGYKPADYTSQPYDKTIYRGIKLRPNPKP